MFNVAAYNPRRSPVHGLDARAKILLVVVYSVALFCVNTWWGIAVLAAILASVVALARMRLASLARSLIPVGVLLAVMLVANSFAFDVNAAGLQTVSGAIADGVLSRFPPVALFGSFGFVPAGFERGWYFVARVVLLLLASLVLTTTTTSTEITRALSSFLHPLDRLGAPTRDISTVASIAIRFIPVTIDEFRIVRAAQVSRGAGFEAGPLFSKLKAWTSVFVPMFVGLFRRADHLSLAMDARCYGAGEATQLAAQRLSAGQVFVGIAIAAAMIVVAVCG